MLITVVHGPTEVPNFPLIDPQEPRKDELWDRNLRHSRLPKSQLGVLAVAQI